MSSVAAFERAMSYGNYQRALLIAWRTLHRKPGDVTNGMAAFLLEYLPARLDGDALEAAIAVLRTLPSCQTWTSPPIGEHCDPRLGNSSFSVTHTRSSRRTPASHGTICANALR